MAKKTNVLQDLQAVSDFAQRGSDEIAKFKVSVILSPQKLSQSFLKSPKLKWNTVPFGVDSISRIPNTSRGIYAFRVEAESAFLPPHGYVLYVGVAGVGVSSSRSLRARYKDYLNAKKVLRRSGIARMIGTWYPVLKFSYATVRSAVSNRTLLDVERRLNSSLLPPFSLGDMDAEVKASRKAFP